MDISLTGLFYAKKSIDDYLDKEADKELKIREAAERELINRQNRLQVFDPDTNSIVDISDSSQISNLKFRNYKYHSHGVLDNIVLKKTNIPDVPIWFDKEPQKIKISPEEELELKILLKGVTDSNDDKND